MARNYPAHGSANWDTALQAAIDGVDADRNTHVTGSTASGVHGGALGTMTNPLSGLVFWSAAGILTRLSIDANGNVMTRPALGGTAVPAAPVLTAVAGNAYVDLSWSAVATATSYQPLNNGVASGAPVSGTGVRISGLTNTTAYPFSLTASNVAGTSAVSNVVTVTPTAGSVGVVVPAAPTLTATPAPTQITLNIGSVTGAATYKITRLSGGGGTSGVALVGAAQQYGSGYSTTAVLNKPTGAAAGHVGYVHVTVYNTFTVATPTGWTQLSHADDSTSSVYIFRRVFDGTEAASFSFVASYVTPGQISATLTLLSGVAATSEDVATPAWTSATTSAPTTGSIAAVTASDGVLVFVSQAKQTGRTLTYGAGFTKITEGGTSDYTTSSVALGTGGVAASVLGPYSSTATASSVYQTTFVAVRAAAPVAGGAGTLIYTGAGLSFVDAGLVNGTAQSYQAVASNSAGDSPSSPAASATPQAAVVSSVFAAIQQGVYRNNAYTTAPKPIGQTPGGVADYAAWAGKNTSPSQMHALDYADVSTKAAQEVAGILQVWQPTGRKIILGGVGVPVSPDTWATCASGAYDTTWTNFAHNLVTYGQSTCVLRPAHEMDGTWFYYNNLVQTDLPNFLASWRRFYGIVKAIAPGVIFEWNPTSGVTDLTRLNSYYPGDAYVDRVGCDCYDGWVAAGATPTSPWTTAQKQSEWNSITLPALNLFTSFAQSHGKPLSFPEWGLRLWESHAGGDNDYFVQQMVAFMTTPANNVVFQAFWEDPSSGGRGVFDPDSGRVPAFSVPLSRAVFRTALGF